MNEYRFARGKEYVVTDGALACPGTGDYYDGPAEEVLCPEILRLAEEVERLSFTIAQINGRAAASDRLMLDADVARADITDLIDRICGDVDRFRHQQAEAQVRILQETIRTLRADAQRERERLRPLLERCEILVHRLPESSDPDDWSDVDRRAFENAVVSRGDVLAALRAELGKE